MPLRYAFLVLALILLNSCTDVNNQIVPYRLPTLSKESGFYTEPFLLTMNMMEGESVYYTIDGSKPDLKNLEDVTLNSIPNERTLKYHSPIRVFKDIIPYNAAYQPTTDYIGPAYWRAGEWKAPIGNNSGIYSIRTITVDKDGAIKKSENGYYYFESNIGQLPIVSILGNFNDFFSQSKGLLTSPDYRGSGALSERPGVFSYINTQGKVLISAECGIRGGGSRIQPSTTLNVFFRDEYGVPNISGEVLRKEKDSKVESLTIRNGGSNWFSSILNNLIGQKFAIGLNFEKHHEHSVLLYFNNEFWGVAQLTDKVDNFSYLQSMFGFKKEERDKIDLIEMPLISLEGDDSFLKESFLFLENALKNNTGILSDPDYNYFDSYYFDTESLIDYLSFQIIIGNTDWPYTNTLFWRYENEDIPEKFKDGRFRPILHDLDLSIGNPLNHGGIPEAANIFDAIDNYLSTDPYKGLAPYSGPEMGWPSGSGMSYFFRCLMTNKIFLDKLITNISIINELRFNSPETIQIALEEINAIRPYMERHTQRWRYPSNLDEWVQSTQSITKFLKARFSYVRTQIADFYAKKTENQSQDLSRITIESMPSTGGTVIINDINPELKKIKSSQDSNEPLNLYLPQQLSLTLKAVPKPGYKFLMWRNNEGISTSEILKRTVTTENEYKAIFIKE